jgi:hypothetical protein
MLSEQKIDTLFNVGKLVLWINAKEILATRFVSFRWAVTNLKSRQGNCHKEAVVAFISSNVILPFRSLMERVRQQRGEGNSPDGLIAWGEFPHERSSWKPLNCELSRGTRVDTKHDIEIRHAVGHQRCSRSNRTLRSIQAILQHLPDLVWCLQKF